MLVIGLESLLNSEGSLNFEDSCVELVYLSFGYGVSNNLRELCLLEGLNFLFQYFDPPVLLLFIRNDV